MFFIPGFVISVFTFPGVVVHELAHQLFCRWCRVPVYKVEYFQIKNPCGYVIHEATSKPMKNFLTAVGPFLVNTLLGLIIVIPTFIELFYSYDLSTNLGALVFLINLGLLWLGISILMHAFPSMGDARALNESILSNPEVPFIAKVLVAPVIGLIYIGAFGSILWLDLIYAVAITYFAPRIFLLFL